MAVTVALAVHVLGVVLWIGGVGLVTTVLLPAARAAEAAAPATGAAWFEAVERRFARQARWTVAITGLSGLFMLDRLGLWSAWRSASMWWIGAMLGVWLIFALMLFIVEPFALRRQRVGSDAGRLRAMQIVHAILLALSVVTVVGAVLGSHGISFTD